jgi:hypothetical protein
MPPGASSADLTWVSCVSGTDCVAVGVSVGQFPVAGGMLTGEGPLAEHWDGVAWTIMPTPNPSALFDGHPDGQLLGVSCASSTACTAVGYYRKTSRRKPFSIYVLTLAERWDGTRWTIQPTPTPEPVAGEPQTPGGLLNAVSCPSVAACMAGGDMQSGGSLAEYWNGRKWSIEKTDDPHGLTMRNPETNDLFTGVACTSPAACVAVGASTDNGFDVEVTSPLAERWDGTKWWRMSLVVPPGPPLAYSALVGVSCVSSTACAAVGTTADATSNLIELWNGRDWMIEPAPSPASAYASSLGGVSCSGTFCSAVGRYGTTSGDFAQALTSTVVSTPVRSASAGITITGLRATPLRQGCVTEIDTSERDVNAVIADATCRHFRLTVNGTIEVGGRLARTGRGEVTGSIMVKLLGRPVHAAARTTAAAGRWRFSLVVPGINLDPVPPSYLIVVEYGGANSWGPVTAERRIRVESEPAGFVAYWSDRWTQPRAPGCRRRAIDQGAAPPGSAPWLGGHAAGLSFGGQDCSRGRMSGAGRRRRAGFRKGSGSSNPHRPRLWLSQRTGRPGTLLCRAPLRTRACPFPSTRLKQAPRGRRRADPRLRRREDPLP